MSEYTYDIDKYTIGVDENGEDGIGMTVAKIENGGIKFLGNCYGENARCIDLLIQENKQLKEKVQDLKADYGTIAQIERDLYKEVIEEVSEYINSKVISNGEIIDQLRKIEVKELLQILDKAKEN